MFRGEFQGGSHFDVLVAQGKIGVGNYGISGVKPVLERVYDKEVKGNVFTLSHRASGSSPSVNMPSERNISLGLTQSVICFQLNISPSSEFSLDVTVTDQSQFKRKFILATACKVVSVTPLHAKLPLSPFKKGTWVSLTIDLCSLVQGLYRGQSFKHIVSIFISSVCKIRRIFTLRDTSVELPRGMEFPIGVEHEEKLINFVTIEKEFPAECQRASHSAPKSVKSLNLSEHIREVTSKEQQKPIGKFINNKYKENYSNDSIDSLVSSHGSGDISTVGRQGASSAPVSRKGYQVNPRPPALTKKVNKSSSKLRARAYSNEKEIMAISPPNSNIIESIEPQKQFQSTSNPDGLFTFSSKPRVAPEPEPLPVVPPFTTALNDPPKVLPELKIMPHSEDVPHFSKKYSADINDVIDEEKENAESEASVTARTNAQTPSDYDWRNYAAPDTDRSATSLEQSMLNSIVDPNYHDREAEVPNPLSALEDLSLQSSKFNMSSRMDFTSGSKSFGAKMMSKPLTKFDDPANMPSLEALKKNDPARFSPPLLIDITEDQNYDAVQNDFKVGSAVENSPQRSNNEEEIELIYDADFNCYYDPKTHKYYELKR